MNQFLHFALYGAMFATFLVLILGITNMFRGGPKSSETSNSLMRMRVILQGVALALFVLIFLLLR